MKSFRIVSLVLALFVLFTQIVAVPIYITVLPSRPWSPYDIYFIVLGILFSTLMCFAVNGALRKISWALIGLVLGFGSVWHILVALPVEDYLVALIFHGIFCVYFLCAILAHSYPFKL